MIKQTTKQKKSKLICCGITPLELTKNIRLESQKKSIKHIYYEIAFGGKI